MEPRHCLSLNDMLADSRFSRLLGQQGCSCALQLFVLRLEQKGKETEQRLLYGRLVPYGFANHCWHTSIGEVLSFGKGIRVQFVKLTLYIDGQTSRTLIEGLCQGETLGTVSQRLNLAGDSAFSDEAQNFCLSEDKWTLRPFIYLPSKGAYTDEPYESPYDSDGACSVALVLKDKASLFKLHGKGSSKLFEWCVKQLSQTAGLTFRNLKDCSRLGELELMVFPMRGENEESLLDLTFDKEKSVFNLRYDVSHFENTQAFLACLKVWDDRQLLHAITRQGKPIDGVLNLEFAVTEEQATCYSELQLEIYGERSEGTFELCGRWGERYFRGINISTGIIGAPVEPVETQFFRKASDHNKQKQNAVLIPVNQGIVNRQRVKAWNDDEWIDVNHQFLDWVKKSRVEPSEARFFPPQAGQSYIGGALFVQWLKEAFEKYPEHQWVLVDPYFDEIGLQLLSSAGSCAIHFDVVTTEQTGTPDRNESWRERLQTAGREFCQHTRARLQLYILKDKVIHDRYFWIEDNDGEVIEGFHLSNSLQGATQLYPLLITPIPKDVLRQVQQYVSNKKKCSQKPSMIFDAKDVVVPPINPIDRLMAFPRIGEILSEFYEIESLKGLYGDELKQRLEQEGILLEDHFSRLPLVNVLVELTLAADSTRFEAYWRVFTVVVSRSSESSKELIQFRDECKVLSQPLMKYLQTRLRGVFPDQAYSRQLFHERLLRSDDVVTSDPFWYKHSAFAPLSQEDQYAVKTVWSADAEGLLSMVSDAAGSFEKQAKYEKNDAPVHWNLVLYVLKVAEEAALYYGSHDIVQKLLRQTYVLFRQLGTTVLLHRLLEGAEAKDVVASLSEWPEKNRRCVIFTWLLLLLQMDKETAYLGLRTYVQKYQQAWITTTSLQEIMAIGAECGGLSLYAPFVVTDLLGGVRERSLFDCAGRLLWKDFLQRSKKAANYKQQQSLSKESFLQNKIYSPFFCQAAASYFPEILPTHRKELLCEWYEQVRKFKRILQRPLACAAQTILEWDNAADWCQGMYTLGLLCRCHLVMTRQTEPQLEKLTDELATLAGYADKEQRVDRKKDLDLRRYQVQALQLLSDIRAGKRPKNADEKHPNGRINWMMNQFASLKAM